MRKKTRCLARLSSLLGRYEVGQETVSKAVLKAFRNRFGSLVRCVFGFVLCFRARPYLTMQVVAACNIRNFYVFINILRFVFSHCTTVQPRAKTPAARCARVSGGIHVWAQS